MYCRMPEYGRKACRYRLFHIITGQNCNDIEGVVKKLELGKYEVRYATVLTELDGGQKLVRFYDPSGNLIEIRTPWDKFVNRE